MFQTKIGNDISEISHKLIERPTRSVYFNHIHNHAEILLFISGDADYNIDGRTFKPKPYDLIFIPAATYHYLIPTSHAPYENYVIGFMPSFISAEKYNKLFTAPLMVNIKNERELCRFFSRLDVYRESFSADDFELCARSLITELTTYLCYVKDTVDGAEGGSPPIIHDIVRYISANIEESIDADSVSRHLMLSRSYVQNIFSQNMHIGLKKYIMQKKIYAAHADILSGLSPSEACEKYSFGDYSSFYRLYKKHFSASPKNKRG